MCFALLCLTSKPAMSEPFDLATFDKSITREAIRSDFAGACSRDFFWETAENRDFGLAGPSDEAFQDYGFCLGFLSGIAYRDWWSDPNISRVHPHICLPGNMHTLDGQFRDLFNSAEAVSLITSRAQDGQNLDWVVEFLRLALPCNGDWTPWGVSLRAIVSECAIDGAATLAMVSDDQMENLQRKLNIAATAHCVGFISAWFWPDPINEAVPANTDCFGEEIQQYDITNSVVKALSVRTDLDLQIPFYDAMESLSADDLDCPHDS